MTMTFYNGWPAHGPNETQILKKSDITSLKDDLQGYLRNGRQATVLERVKSKVLELVERVMTVENSASPDGNTLRLETGTVLNFAE